MNTERQPTVTRSGYVMQSPGVVAQQIIKRSQAKDDRVSNTLRHLRLCRQARAAGYPVAFTTDPAWLVQMAINRRAGWFDDPSHLRGSAMPVPVRQATPNGAIVIRYGKYPRRASGDAWSHSTRWRRSY